MSEWYVVGAVVIGIVLWMVLKTMSGEGCAEVSQETLLKYLEEDRDMCIMDVRSQREYDQGHIPKAIHMDYQAISTHLEDLEPHRRKDLIVYCEHGMRARMAIGVLRRAGFSRLYHIRGDMVEWKRSGQGLET